MNFDFSIMKKIWVVSHEKLINIKGRHGILDMFMEVSHTQEMTICVVNQLKNDKNFLASAQFVSDFTYKDSPFLLEKCNWTVINFDLSVFKYLNQLYSKGEGAGMYWGLLLSSVITMEHMFLDLPYLEVRAFPFTTKVFQKEFT